MAAAASESSSKKRKGTPNRRWTKDMDDVLIRCLAEQAKAGMKVDKSFKQVAFVETTKAMYALLFQLIHGLAAALKLGNNSECLHIILNNSDPWLMTKALALPGACNLQAPPFSQCNGVAGAPAATPAISTVGAPADSVTLTTPSVSSNQSLATPSVPSNVPAAAGLDGVALELLEGVDQDT
ncbi:hypothetical protein J5N97_022754 [Dioscorea zingiberensis]|uniref:Uncharacterized protein n=1 Tax=Dioscorea zingiberensis TaxID=325984 RepID=A0A9D5CB21_9LILI|nr:hypothetical protein J5N97_022754 [Dioscorea zingiberensis]